MYGPKLLSAAEDETCCETNEVGPGQDEDVPKVGKHFCHMDGDKHSTAEVVRHHNLVLHGNVAPTCIVTALCQIFKVVVVYNSYTSRKK